MKGTECHPNCLTCSSINTCDTCRYGGTTPYCIIEKPGKYHYIDENGRL